MQQRSPLFTLSLKEQNQLIELLEKVQTNNTQIPTGFLNHQRRASHDHRAN